MRGATALRNARLEVQLAPDAIAEMIGWVLTVGIDQQA
jgi:hypothetical protein